MKLNTHTKAVLFDLDGVLIESHEVWFRLLQDASGHFGGRKVTREEFEPLFGQGAEADIRHFGLKCTPAQLNSYFFENFERCSTGGGVWVDPEAHSMLRTLRETGLRTAIVTNTMRPLALALLKSASLLELFDAVAASSEVKRAKPAPDVLFLALERLGNLKSEAVWMIGDSMFDREAARAAGIRFIGYRQDGDTRIERLGELPDVVQENVQNGTHAP